MALFLRRWSRAAVAPPGRTHPRRSTVRSVSFAAGGSHPPSRDAPNRRSGRPPGARVSETNPAALSHRRDLGSAAAERSRHRREAFPSDPPLSPQPWKTLLEAPARASWRATDPRRDPPEHLRAAMRTILDEGDRTSKQLRRAHRKVLSIQSDLADLRERERRTLVNGTRGVRQHQQQQQQRLQRSFNDSDNDSDGDIHPDGARHGNNHRGRSSSSPSVSPVYYGYDETLATLKHRLTPNYAITKRVLAECQSLLGGRMVPAATATGSSDGGMDGELNSQSDSESNPRRRLVYSRNWKPRRVLDFGIGCGSASAAAIDLFGSDGNGNDDGNDGDDGSPGIEWIHGIDPSRPMRECAKKLIEEMTRGGHRTGGASDPASGRLTTPPKTPRITFGTSLSPSPDDYSSQSSSPSSSSRSGEGSFDLALLVYAASDLPDVSSFLAAAAMAFEKLGPGGVLVAIEPGTPDGFNSIRAVRNMLLDCCPPHDPGFEWEDRCHVVAPCTHNGSCPMERHKKNFFGGRGEKPVGKLGRDLPQELGGGERGPERAISIDDDDDDDDDEDDNDDDEDDNEMDRVDSRDTPTMSETDAFHSSFCSFVHSVSGDSRRKGEKFSYLAAQKKRFRHRRSSAESSEEAEGDPFRGDSVTDLLSDALDAASFEADDLAARTFEAARELSARYENSETDDLGLELLRGEDKRGSMGRIVRAPIKKKGHVYIDYCAAPGRIVRSRVTKALAASAAPGLYGAARKSRWGGLWPDATDRVFAAAGRDTKEPKKP